MRLRLYYLLVGEPLNTEGNTEHEEETEQTVSFVQNQQNAWDVLESIMGTVEAPPDWSINHDHYLYETAKRYPDNSQ